MIDLRQPAGALPFTLLDFLPSSIASDPEILALSRALDPEILAVSRAIVEAIIWPRIDEQPEWVLDALAWDHRLAELALWDNASITGKRTVLKKAFLLRKRSGTVWAVKQIFELLDLTARVIEWWEIGGAAYAYWIIVDATEAGITLLSLQQIPDFLLRFAPARSHLNSLAVEVDSPGPLYPRPALTIGHLTEIAYGGP